MRAQPITKERRARVLFPTLSDIEGKGKTTMCLMLTILLRVEISISYFSFSSL